MVTVQEARQSVSQAREQIGQARQQIKEEEKKIPQLTGRFLRQTSSLEGRKFRRDIIRARSQIKEAEESIASYEQQVGGYEKGVQEYLKTESGKLQYAKEQNLTAQPVYGRVVKGGTIEVIGYKYQTPYGEVVDYSPKERLEYQQRKLAAIESGETAIVGGALGLTSPKKIQQAGISVPKFLRGERIEIKEDVGSLRRGQTIQLTKDKTAIEIETKAPIIEKPIIEIETKAPIIEKPIPSQAVIQRPEKIGFFKKVGSAYGKYVEGIDWLMGVTPAERLIKQKQEQERAIRKLERLKEVEAKTFNILGLEIKEKELNPFRLIAKATVRAGEIISKPIEKKLPEESILRKKVKFPITESLTTLYTFAGFEPLTRTATQQQISKAVESEYVYDYVTKRYIKKKDVIQYLSTKKGLVDRLNLPEKIGKTYNYKLSFQTKFERAKALYNAAKPEKRTEVLKLIEEAYGKTFVKDFLSQEGLGVSKTVASTSKVAPIIKTKPTPSVFVGRAQEGLGVSKTVASISKVAPIIKTKPTPSVFAGRGLYERTQEVQAFVGLKPAELKGIAIPETAAALLSIKSFTPIEKTKQSEEQKSSPKQLIGIDLKKAQDVFTGQTTSTLTKQLQDLKSFQTPSLNFQTIQATQQSQILRSQQTQKQKQKQKTLEEPFFLRFPREIGLKKRDMSTTKQRQIELFGRRFGRDIRVGVAFSRAEARTKLRSFLTGTLGRSGYALEEGKKIDIGLRGGQFRPSKKDPSRIVQRAKFSLGTRSEVKEILSFKRSKGKRRKNVFL